MGPDGALCRAADVHDAVAMVRIALAGEHLLQGQAAGPSAADIDQVLRQSTEGQRQRAVAALRQLEGLVREIGEG